MSETGPGDGTNITPEMVLERVRAAGGWLRLADLGEDEVAAWRRASKVVSLRLLRVGHERLYCNCGAGRVDLRLIRTDRVETSAVQPPEEWVPPPPVVPRTAEFVGRRVPVPSKVSKADPLLEQLESAVDWPEQWMRRTYGGAPGARRPVQRMRRIWQAIIDEALFRGYSVSVTHNRLDVYDRGRLVLKIGRDEFPLELYGDRKVPLRLRITEQHPHRRRGYDTWTDSEERPLQTVIGEIFTHIERWAELLIAQCKAEKQRAMEQLNRRKRAETEARQKFAENYRRAALAEQLDASAFADDARAFAAALLVVAADLEPERAERVRAWSDWSLAYAERTDPRATRAGAPTVPTPTWQELQPYMNERGFW